MAKRQVITAIHATDNMHVAFVKEGASQKAQVVLRKTKEPAPLTPPTNLEESVMDPIIIKALAGLTDEGKAYMGALPDAEIEPWLKKSAEDREVDLTKARTEKATKEAELEKAKGGSPEVVELKKTVASLLDTVKSLTARDETLTKERREQDLLKTASSTYGMVPGAIEILKSIDSMTDEQKAPHLAGLQARQDLAKTVSREYGAAVVDDETSAAALIKTKVVELAKAKNITEAQAAIAFNDDPANRDLIERVLDEEAAG